MNILSVAALLIFSSLSAEEARGQLPADPAEYRAWENEALQDIASDRAKGDMDALATWVFNMKSARKREPEPRPVYRAACEAVISFPGHVDYFRKALDVRMALEFAEASGEPREPSGDFRRPQLFQIMEQLRSPGIVGLLGEMLEDERNPWKDTPRSDVGFPSTNAIYATRALTNLGIEGVPEISLEGSQNREAAKEQWKLWFAQVKAGTRTFRFKGDPQEYNLKGPVGERPSKSGAVSTAARSQPQPSPPTQNETGRYRWVLWAALKRRMARRRGE
jgi:hypothetical protein